MAALPPSSSSPASRQPAVRLIADGYSISGILTAEVISNNYYAADQFQVSIALGADPVAGPPYWSGIIGTLFDVQFSLDGMGYTSLIQGHADELDMDLQQGVVQIRGRDLTAVLIEARTQETFSNRTASEIATILAMRHNLTPIVTSTTTPVGRYYENEHDRITLGEFSHATTEWDLMVFLARQEGFDVFVQGSALYFQPRASTTPPSIVIEPDSVVALRLSRSLTLARDIEVTVKSWNSHQKAAFTQTVRGQATSGTSERPSGVQTYVYVRPNMTQNQALQFAQSRLSEISQHERIVDITMPGELTLTARSTVMLDGTGTDFDQVYYIDTIERTAGLKQGFSQQIRAKNTSPRTQTTTPADTVGAVTG
ncbi:MAG: phage late control D family protein [Acetobacteraceae bacterium]